MDNLRYEKIFLAVTLLANLALMILCAAINGIWVLIGAMFGIIIGASMTGFFSLPKFKELPITSKRAIRLLKKHTWVKMVKDNKTEVVDWHLVKEMSITDIESVTWYLKKSKQ